MRDITVQLEEGQRQMILLALAKLSVERPGFLAALEELALKMDNPDKGNGPELFRRFHEQNQDLPFLIAPTAPMMVALTKSVKLQSHYALLLNGYDGGERRQFADGEAWITRLIETGTFARKAKP